jgi:hypothetical protein
MFYCAGTGMQIVLSLLVGGVAQFNLIAGFGLIGIVYALAFVSASWPVGSTTPAAEAKASD